jgi:hypothetical protein
MGVDTKQPSSAGAHPDMTLATLRRHMENGFFALMRALSSAD